MTEFASAQMPFREVLNQRARARLAGSTIIYTEVHAERIRAHEKHGPNGNSREWQEWTQQEWLPILMEELGEVAHEMTYDADGSKEALRKELVQVAAMACSWVAAIDAAADPDA